MRRVELIRPLGLASVVVVGANCSELIGLSAYYDAICTPGEQTSDDCPYPGPAGTKGVGICKAGVRTCAKDGLSWSECSDAALPRAEEDCATPEDDNCDGHVNEASAGCCEPGTMLSCYSGPEGTEEVGICAAGTRLCGNDGKPPAACTGDVKPAQETCSDPKDEDCDGRDCVEWAGLFGDAATQGFSDLVVDPLGNTIAVGTLFGSVTLDGTTLTEAGSGDVLIVKFDAAGKPVWGRAIGDTGAQGGGVVAIDSTGAIILTGCTDTPLNVGGSLVSPGGFIAKLSADGQTIAWVHGFGAAACSSGLFGSTVGKIAVTSTNDIVVVGAFAGSIDFGGGPVASAGGTDGFAVKMGGADGIVSTAKGHWIKVFGDGQDQSANDVAIDPVTGEVLVVGEFAGAISFGLPLTNVTSQEGKDSFVLRLWPDASFGSLYTYGGQGDQRVRSIAIVDGAGSYAISGSFQGTVDLGGATVTTADNTSNAFLAVFDNMDTVKWAGAYAASADFYGFTYDIGQDPSGNIVIGGVYNGAIDFGGGALTTTGTDLNVFVAKVSSTGQQLWAKQFDSGGLFFGRTRVLPTGETVMAGFTPGPIDFGTGLLTPAGTDAFIAKFGL